MPGVGGVGAECVALVLHVEDLVLVVRVKVLVLSVKGLVLVCRVGNLGV